MKRFVLATLMIITIISSYAQVVISMENKGGVFYIPGKVNGLPLQFIFDTGASNVYISLTEALFMLKNGYLTNKDFGKNSFAQVADGSIVENTEVTLREMEVGGIKLHNIKAYVSNSLNAPLLFGQSAIQKLGPIQINGNKLIISNGGANLPSNESAFSLYQKSYQECEAANYDYAIKLSQQAIDMCTDKRLRALLYDNIAYALNHLGKKKEAIDALNTALGEDLMCESPGYNLGVNYFEIGEIDKALRAFNIFLERHKDIQNIELLANVYAYKGDCHSKNGEILNAEKAYKESLSLKSNTQSMLGLADLYLNTGKYDEAIPLYKSAIEYEPNRISNIKRHYQLGYCYAILEMKEEALAEFHNCLTAITANRDLISPALKSGDEDMQGSAVYNLYLGTNAQLWIARLTNNPLEAISYYEQIFEIPGISRQFIFQDFLNWASAYTVNGKKSHSMANALEVLKKGLVVLPDNPEILYSCALYTDSSSAEHLEYLMRILEQEYTYNPISFDYGTVYNNIAWHYALNKKFQDALPYAQTAIKMVPQHIYSWDTIGEIYFNLGRYKEAINAFEHCLESDDPEQVKKAHKYRGNSYLQIGNLKEGQRELKLSE